jgi:tRNA nucleotidyltransferase (CCA-adding enzyme)
VLVTTHENADADGVGSIIAMSLLRPGLGVFLPRGLDPQSRRLWADHEACLPPVLSEANLEDVLKRAAHTELLVVDTARAARLGPLAPHLDRFAQVRAFDTHPATDEDLPRADLPAAGSCTAALALALDEAGVVPDPVRAGVMLVGIHVDTGHFTFPGTTEVDHRGAALCLRWGADPAVVTRYARRGYSAHQLSLLGRMADNVRQEAVFGRSVALIRLETDDYEPDLGSLLTQLREAEGWPTAVMLVATGPKVWLIARTDGEVDAAALLRPLGGGGHREAASAVSADLGMADLERALREGLMDQLGGQRPVEELAVRDFVAIDARAPASEAAELLHRHRINAVPIFSEEARPEEGGPEDGSPQMGRVRRWVGQVSRQEIDAALRHDIGDRPVLAFSARPPGWVPVGASLREVRDTLLHGRGRIWLVGSPSDDDENGGARGLLTRTTVLRSAASPALAGGRKPPHANVVKGKLKASLGPAWPVVRAIGATAQRMGLPCYLVGGGVRDVLLERSVRDVDLVVQGSAPELARELARQHGGEFVVHSAFGTAKWTPPQDGVPAIDLASTRGEHYTDRATLPAVHRAELRQDLFRRDFTINAMAVAVDPDELGLVVDPYGGWSDLQNGVIRVIHGLSFHDDPTRAFRAARFAARFDMRLAGGTLGLLQNAMSTGALDHLGRERLGNELDRILCEDTADRAAELLEDWGLDRAVDPDFHLRHDIIADLRVGYDAHLFAQGLAQSSGEEAPTASDVGWVLMARAIPAERRAAIAALVPGTTARRDRFVHGPERVSQALQRLRRARFRSYTARVLRGLHAAEWVAALARARLDARADQLRPHLMWWWTEGRHIRTVVDGHYLRAQGLPPGPQFSVALEAAQKAAWDGEDGDGQRAAALAAVAPEGA